MTGVKLVGGGIDRKGAACGLPLCLAISGLMAREILPGPLPAASRTRPHPGAEGMAKPVNDASKGPVL
ncbi:hypothetical protein GCM10020216_047040 [Nonomuraea helvata]